MAFVVRDTGGFDMSEPLATKAMAQDYIDDCKSAAIDTCKSYHIVSISDVLAIVDSFKIVEVEFEEEEPDTLRSPPFENA